MAIYKNPLEQAQAISQPSVKPITNWNELSDAIKNGNKTFDQAKRYDYNQRLFGRDNFDELETIVDDVDNVSYNDLIKALENNVYNLKEGESIDIGYGPNLSVYNGAEIIPHVNLLNGYEHQLQTDSLRNYFNQLKNAIDNHKAKYIIRRKIKGLPIDD